MSTPLPAVLPVLAAVLRCSSHRPGPLRRECAPSPRLPSPVSAQVQTQLLQLDSWLVSLAGIYMYNTHFSNLKHGLTFGILRCFFRSYCMYRSSVVTVHVCLAAHVNFYHTFFSDYSIWLLILQYYNVNT